MNLRHHAAAVAAVVSLCLVAPATAHAGGSSPVLSITAGQGFATTAAARSLAVSGSFNFDDLVQFIFPAGLVVWQGSHFVCFEVDGSVREGDAAFVADGITRGEVQALRRAGAATASARMVELRGDRLVVALPAGFTAGSVSAMLYADFDGDQFTSNAVTVPLP